MSLSAEIERVDGSQNDILRAIAQSYGINTSGLKIDQIAEKVKASQKFKLDGLLSVATAGLFDLPADSVPDDVFKKIKTFLDTAQGTADGNAKIVTGSYVGNGKYGASNPNKLTFERVPKIIIFFGETANLTIYTYPVVPLIEGVAFETNTFGSSTAKFSLSEKTVSWFNDTNAGNQLNQSGSTYYYVAVTQEEE